MSSWRRGWILRCQVLSPWGVPAFPTQEAPAHKAIKRARRMVVDYRALNRVTVRKVFLIPDSDQAKATVAGNKFISVGDLKEGFNQVDNEPESAKKMAVITASGTYLPRGLTFGPTNGPEDFQELVFVLFSRRLYKEWSSPRVPPTTYLSYIRSLASIQISCMRMSISCSGP